MMRFLTLAIFLFYAATPIIGYAQTDNKTTTVDKKTITIPVELKPDTTTLKKGSSPFKDPGKPGTQPKQIILKKQVDSARVKARDYYQSAVKKANDKDYQGAIVDFTKSLSYNKSQVTFTKRAYAYLLTNQYDSAIADSKEALRLLYKNFEACTILGIAYYEKKEYDEAFKTFQNACKLNPTNPDPTVFNYMAAIKFLQQDFKMAVVYYDTVAMMDSTFQDVFSNRGMMHHYLGNYNDAVKDYSIAIKLDSTDSNAHNNRAAANMLLKDFSSALTDLNSAIRLNPDYANAYENRGKVRQQLGDMTGACADWAIAVSMGLKTSKELIIQFCK